MSLTDRVIDRMRKEVGKKRQIVEANKQEIASLKANLDQLAEETTKLVIDINGIEHAIALMEEEASMKANAPD